MPEWSPEIVVEEPLARRLLATQFPELELTSLRLAGEGWDNTAWLVDERSPTTSSPRGSSCRRLSR